MREPKDIRLKTHLVDECNHAGKSRSRATGALNRENLKAGVCSSAGRRVSSLGSECLSPRTDQRRREGSAPRAHLCPLGRHMRSSNSLPRG